MKNIVCFGDSNTYGYDPRNGERYKENERWTCLLQRLLGPEFKVYEEGLNGRTLASDRDGFDWLNGLKHLPAILLTHKPVDVLIIMLGTNDCSTELNLCEKDIENGTRALIKSARECLFAKEEPLPKIVLVSPAPIAGDIEKSPFAYQLSEESVRLSKAIASIQEQIAIEEDCYFLDAGNIAKVADDAEHLTREGHTALALELFDMISGIYEDELCDDFFDKEACIETDRLELRLIDECDAKDLYSLFSSDEVLKYFISPKHENEEQTRLNLILSRANAIANRRYYFSVIRKDTKEIVGVILQCSKQDDLFVGTEIGYAYSEKHWGKGYATEALKAMIDFLFSKGVHRICASHILENEASGKVMQKCGMKEEKTAIDEIFYHDHYYSLKYYSIINNKE